MNNFIVTILVVLSGIILWLGQHTAQRNARIENGKLAEKLDDIRASLAETSGVWTNAQANLARRREELNAAKIELANLVEEAQHAALPPDPSREGVWPGEAPYFYLAKKHLGEIAYNAFNGEQRLGREAATLFGMNSTEKIAVDEAFQTLFARMRQLQLTNSERMESKPGVNNENHREISYRIPALTNEFRELRTQFDSAVRGAIGNTRADPFLDRVATELGDDTWLGQIDVPYVVTYRGNREADGRVEHTIQIGHGDAESWSPLLEFPVEPGSALWDYRHLFGEEPLIPLPPGTKKDE
jgi:hypothetical protein